MDKDEIIAELRRVAELLATTSLTRNQFGQHGRIGVTTVREHFGSWNLAVRAAGLVEIPTGNTLNRRSLSDDELLQDIIRITHEVGRQPTIAELSARGHFSVKPYKARWGSLDIACKTAYVKYGFPLAGEETSFEQQPPGQQDSRPPNRSIPTIRKSKPIGSRKKVQYGEPMDFRGLRHAPINEQGVVYLFGMVSRELGFLIESVKAPYPDCEGKRCVDEKRQLWERVLIEFEYQSSNFRLHKHDPGGCDLIVCWIHDWEDCPIEVLELGSTIKHLPNR